MDRVCTANEVDQVRQRYERRKDAARESLYSPLRADNWLSVQEKERALIHWINTCGIAPVQDKQVLEIGCGTGANLLQLIRLGFQPENLMGNELLQDRAQDARRRLPACTQVLVGDAAQLDLAEESFDVVLQSTVFTSILDDEFQQKLADRMWALTKPGGGVLWYDFTFDNPNNPDVRGVPEKRIRELFPEGEIKSWRLTLAPPISRRVAALHPSLYGALNVFPFLRTHLLCWIRRVR